MLTKSERELARVVREAREAWEAKYVHGADRVCHVACWQEELDANIAKAVIKSSLEEVFEMQLAVARAVTETMAKVKEEMNRPAYD